MHTHTHTHTLHNVPICQRRIYILQIPLILMLMCSLLLHQTGNCTQIEAARLAQKENRAKGAKSLKRLAVTASYRREYSEKELTIPQEFSFATDKRAARKKKTKTLTKSNQPA